MSERSSAPSAPPMQSEAHRDLPSTKIVEFIRYCHRRRSVGWPEIYDEMCGVAARREFNGWDQDELSRHGLSFSLLEMPRLASWVRTALAGSSEGAKPASMPTARQAAAG